MTQATRKPSDEVSESLAYIRTVYNKHRAPGSPEWEVAEPRVEKYLRHLFSGPKEYTMTDAEKFEKTKESLQFCPVCQKELDQHPHSDNTKSCFVHGDFILMWVDDDLIVQWRSLAAFRPAT